MIEWLKFIFKKNKNSDKNDVTITTPLLLKSSSEEKHKPLKNNFVELSKDIIQFIGSYLNRQDLGKMILLSKNYNEYLQPLIEKWDNDSSNRFWLVGNAQLSMGEVAYGYKNSGTFLCGFDGHSRRRRYIPAMEIKNALHLKNKNILFPSKKDAKENALHLQDPKSYSHILCEETPPIFEVLVSQKPANKQTKEIIIHPYYSGSSPFSRRNVSIVFFESNSPIRIKRGQPVGECLFYTSVNLDQKNLQSSSTYLAEDAFTYQLEELEKAQKSSLHYFLNPNIDKKIKILKDKEKQFERWKNGEKITKKELSLTDEQYEILNEHRGNVLAGAYNFFFSNSRKSDFQTTSLSLVTKANKLMQRPL